MNVAIRISPPPPSAPLPSLPQTYRQSLPVPQSSSRGKDRQRHASTPVSSFPVSPNFNPSKPPPIPLPPTPKQLIPFPSLKPETSMFGLSRKGSLSTASTVADRTSASGSGQKRTSHSTVNIVQVEKESASRPSLDFEDILARPIPKRTKSAPGRRPKSRGDIRPQTITVEDEDSDIDLDASFETSAYRAGVMKTSLEPDFLDRALKHSRFRSSASSSEDDSSSSDESFDLQFVAAKIPSSSIAKLSPALSTFSLAPIPDRQSRISLTAPQNRLLTRKSWTAPSTPTVLSQIIRPEPASFTPQPKGKSHKSSTPNVPSNNPSGGRFGFKPRLSRV